jgi:hypothetical protein
MRKLLAFMTVCVVVVAARTGWILYSRYSANREAEERAEQQKREEARKVTEMLGNGRVKILNLSLEPPVIRIGGESELCYGVSNATSVTIDPIGPVRPAYSTCMKVKPRHDTNYLMTAKDAAGNTETAQLKLHVY